MTLEETLLEITKVNPKKFKDRQKLLATVARTAINKNVVTDEVWDKLPDPVLTWIEAAAKAIKSKKQVPDFPDAEETEDVAQDIGDTNGPPEDEDDEEGDDEEGEEGEEAEDASAELDPNETDEPVDHEAEEAVEAAAEADTVAEAEGDGAGVSEPEADPDEPAPAKKPKKAKKEAKPKKEPRPKKARAKKEPETQEPSDEPRYANLTGNKNRYGIYEGTKLDDVIKMLEAGCTQAEIKAVHGDTKYNLERRLKDAGHKFVIEGAKRTLIHKDDIEAEPKPKGKKK